MCHTANVSMTLQTEIPSTETSDFLKQIIVLKSFDGCSNPFLFFVFFTLKFVGDHILRIISSSFEGMIR